MSPFLERHILSDNEEESCQNGRCISAKYKWAMEPLYSIIMVSNINVEYCSDGVSVSKESTRSMLETSREPCPDATNDDVHTAEENTRHKLGTNRVVCPDATIISRARWLLIVVIIVMAMEGCQE